MLDFYSQISALSKKGVSKIGMKFFKKIKSAIKFVLNQIQPKTIIRANIVQLAPSELLKGRCALITGGTSGIGFAIAQAFLNAGASVCITGRRESRLNDARERLAKVAGAERVACVVMDSADVVSIDAGFEKIITLPLPSKIDILVNNAGVAKGCFGNMKEADYDTVLNTNLKGAYFLSQRFANYLKENRSRGNILNICSSSSLRPANSPYTLSKWGLRGLTLGLAKTLIPHGIVVNGLAPGPTATPMLIKEEMGGGINLKSNPSGRYATAEEIANAALFLVSDCGRMVVGDVLFMTGGAGTITFDDMNYSF